MADTRRRRTQKVSAADYGDHEGGLAALQFRLAKAIDECESMRDLAALSRQYVDVSERLLALGVSPAKKAVPTDEFSKRLAAKRAAATTTAG